MPQTGQLNNVPDLMTIGGQPAGQQPFPTYSFAAAASGTNPNQIPNRPTAAVPPSSGLVPPPNAGAIGVQPVNSGAAAITVTLPPVAPTTNNGQTTASGYLIGQDVIRVKEDPDNGAGVTTINLAAGDGGATVGSFPGSGAAHGMAYADFWVAPGAVVWSKLTSGAT